VNANIDKNLDDGDDINKEYMLSLTGSPKKITLIYLKFLPPKGLKFKIYRFYFGGVVVGYTLYSTSHTLVVIQLMFL